MPGEKLPRGGGAGLKEIKRQSEMMRSEMAARRLENKQIMQPVLAPLQEQPLSSMPSDWSSDECFAYFNPTTEAGLAHWLGAWNEALYVMMEHVSIMEGRRAA